MYSRHSVCTARSPVARSNYRARRLKVVLWRLSLASSISKTKRMPGMPSWKLRTIRQFWGCSSTPSSSIWPSINPRAPVSRKDLWATIWVKHAYLINISGPRARHEPDADEPHVHDADHDVPNEHELDASTSTLPIIQVPRFIQYPSKKTPLQIIVSLITAVSPIID